MVRRTLSCFGQVHASQAEDEGQLYKRNLDRLVDAWGHLPATEITTGRVQRFTETFGERYSSRDDALTVLRLIMETARRYELISHNPCSRLGLSKPPPRQAYWRDADIEAFLKVCRDTRVALAFKLALYTGQRAGDVLAFRWGQYDGEQITGIRQQKTGALAQYSGPHRAAGGARWLPRGSVGCASPGNDNACRADGETVALHNALLGNPGHRE